MSSDIFSYSAGCAPTLLDWLTCIFTGLGMVILLAYTIYTKRVADLTRKALKQTRKSNKATRESNKIARDSMEWAMRAHLVPVGFAKGALQSIDVRFKNTGGMPATGIEVSATFVLIEADNSSRSFPGEHYRLWPLGNGETFTVSLLPEAPLPPEEVAHIEKGRKRLAAGIVAAYSDAFDTRETKLNCEWTEKGWKVWERDSLY